MPRFLVRKEPTTMRTRLRIYPVAHSSRIPASISAMPVVPACQSLIRGELHLTRGDLAKAQVGRE